INYFKSNGASVVYDNIIMQANAIKFAGEYGVKKFMYIGSGAVYGNNLESPFNEEHSIESIQQGGMEPYAVAKIAGLEMCKQFNGYNGCKYIVMLPTHIYGTKNIKRIKNGLIETTIKILHEAKKQNIDTVSLDIWGTGKKSVRQFLYIDDVVEAMLYFMESYTDDMPVNISTDEAVSLDDMVKTVSSIVGYLGNISYQYDKPENGAQRLLSTKKMKSLGWNPKFSLHDGIRDFYRWYCSNQ
ncbi:MAG: NAD-dependent epimerase/dehydratase family protein, partial [Selenomonadaceae bacterium]|nr:NAD-dependent epimerase/dehydratase family protein [Selenomonadaceae bacterium]